jgi:7,8-dihydropterin-6-yl-methyl-4-(beta-D-ribofuranosyl)aminobenzene 5'-phosphate synthase
MGRDERQYGSRRRISPLWWPLLFITSPVLLPLLAVKNHRFRRNAARAQSLNDLRLQAAEEGRSKAQEEAEERLELPELAGVEITVLVEEKAAEGYVGDAGVSYFFRTERGTLLYDVGFGPERPALRHNSSALGIRFDMIDSLAISHLHPDHMGGLKAARKKQVQLSENLRPPAGRGGRIPCYLPDFAEADEFDCEVIDKPAMLTAGMASTGPLARSLFFTGLTEEQALLARLRGKGLVIITGCGHQTIPLLLRYVRTLFDEPVYAVGGGMHFPVTGSRGNRAGIEFQRIMGTGKPPWQRVTEEDMEPTIRALNEHAVRKVFLSAHDSCDYALQQLSSRITAETTVLRAGERYIV